MNQNNEEQQAVVKGLIRGIALIANSGILFSLMRQKDQAQVPERLWKALYASQEPIDELLSAVIEWQEGLDQ